MIVYYSATGNSKYCADILAEKLKDKLFDSFHSIKESSYPSLNSDSPWVFVCPTYAWQIPKVFEKFLLKSVFSGSKKAYFVMTCGGDIGNSEKPLKKLCIKLGFEFMGVHECVMPENYPALFSVPSEKTSAKIIAKAVPKLIDCAESISREISLPAFDVSLVDRFKTSAINAVFCAGVKFLPPKANESCVGCGLCESLCPVNNIVISNGKPEWQNRCIHCMACLNLCPTRAVECLSSKGKRRYRCVDYKAD